MAANKDNDDDGTDGTAGVGIQLDHQGIPEVIDGLPGRFSKLSLLLPISLPFESWMRLGETLQAIDRGAKWWIGDWLNYGEREYGETYSQAVLVTGRDASYLATLKWVASVFPPNKRRTGLSFQHHVEVCSLMNVAPNLAEEILNLAEEEDLTSKQVREDAREAMDELNNGTPEAIAQRTIAERKSRGASTRWDDEPVEPETLGHVEWLDDLLDIVLALVGTNGDNLDMLDVYVRASEWVDAHDAKPKGQND